MVQPAKPGRLNFVGTFDKVGSCRGGAYFDQPIGVPIPNSINGKRPLPLSLLERYAKTKSTALRPNGAMILAAFILPPESLGYSGLYHALLILNCRLILVLTIFSMTIACIGASSERTSGCRLVWAKSYAGARCLHGHKHDTMTKVWL